MKKCVRRILGVVIFLGSIFIFVGVLRWIDKSPKKPYANIEVSDIKNVYVLHGVHDPYRLTDDEKETFLFLLKGIVIYQKDNSYTGYDGVNARQFYVEFENGRTVFLAPANPFFIIDKKGYRTEYVPCDELAKFRSNIIETEFTNWSDY